MGSGSGSGKKKAAEESHLRRLAGKDKKSSGFFKSGDKASDDRDYPNQKMSNIFKNAILPLDFRKGKVVQGTLVYVAAEVLVSKVLRRIMKADNKSVMELAAVHTISLGVMGGTTAVFTKEDGYGADDFSKKIKGGAMGIPAVFIGQYIYNTFGKGFHMPFWSMKDALIMAAAKILTRPLLAMVYDKSKFTQNALDAQGLLEDMQVRASTFKKKKKATQAMGS
jgi:hypothetical protein